MRITHSHFVTGDPLQDTMASTYAPCSSLLPGSNVGVWLSLILTNTYFDDYRREQRRPLEYPTDAFIDHQLAAVNQHSQTEIHRAEDQALKALPDHDVKTAMQALLADVAAARGYYCSGEMAARNPVVKKHRNGARRKSSAPGRHNNGLSQQSSGMR
jgi:DNA-directed RNA polymerase specialized sigma24 family protein